MKNASFALIAFLSLTAMASAEACTIQYDHNLDGRFTESQFATLRTAFTKFISDVGCTEFIPGEIVSNRNQPDYADYIVHFKTNHPDSHPILDTLFGPNPDTDTDFAVTIDRLTIDSHGVEIFHRRSGLLLNKGKTIFERGEIFFLKRLRKLTDFLKNDIAEVSASLSKTK